MLTVLDPDAIYGISYSGRVRTRKISNAGRTREKPDRSEWVGVPVDISGSGLDAATVDRARRTLEGNRVIPKVGDRFFELAGGPLRCAHCQRRMIGYARRHKDRPPNAYYRCDSPARTGSTCPNRRSVGADALEHDAASLFEATATRDALLDLYDRAIEEQGRALGTRGAAQRLDTMTGRMGELEEERRGYLRQNARGLISDDDLGVMLSEVEEKIGAVKAEIRNAQDATETGVRIEAARHSLISADWAEDPDALQPGEWLTLGATPEQIRRAYQRFGARFELDQDGLLTLTLELDLKEAFVANGSHTHGNEHWEFDERGLMRRRDASINDYEIDESERKFH